jgi:putative component of membrane protein insertase Oxa1/YidC/SpoIIIJ protein YidD
MAKPHHALLILLTFVSFPASEAQTTSEAAAFAARLRFPPSDSLTVPRPFVPPFSPERILSNTITLYQVFISSQDLPVCIFELSCSRYGQRALEKHGLMKGILLTSDRFQRCNGFGQKHYHFNPATGKFVDVP